MNSKIISLLLLTILANLAFVSAELVTLSTGTTTFTQSTNLSYFTIYANNNVNLSLVSSPLPIRITDGNNKYATLSLSNIPSTLANGNEARINVSMTMDSGFSSDLKTYAFPDVIINAINSSDSSITENRTVSFTLVNSFCEAGDIGNQLEITGITDEELDNTDKWVWRPLDNIEIIVKVHNKNITEEISAVVEYGLYDVTDKTFIDLNEDTIDVDIKEKKTESVTINFQVPSSSDIDSDHSYRFYVKAYEDGNEANQCVDQKDNKYFQDVDIKRDNRDVIVSKIIIPESVSCGDTVTLSAKLDNIGKKDEDKVNVRLYSKEIGLNLNKTVTSLDSGDSATVDFNFNVPNNINEKIYVLSLSTDFNYDDNDNTYDDHSEKTFIANLDVSGNCQITTADQVSMSVSMPETITAGDEVTLTATITNTGTAAQSFIISVLNANSFAQVQSITPTQVDLAAGASKPVSIILKINDNAQSNSFTLRATTVSSGKITEKNVPLTIEEKSGSFSGFASLFTNMKSNWLVWVIVLVNIVLIVLIIVIAVKIARK